MARIALITGGNRGLGRAAAHALADDGADIILTYRSNPAEAKAVVAEVEERGRAALALRLDMTDHETFPAFAGELRSQLRERWAREQFDILINNAGFDSLTPFGQTEAATMDALYAVHVKGPVLLTELLAQMISDGGRVLFVSSGLTRYVANPAYSVYAAMKGAVEVYTKYAAKALGTRAITVNAIAPGYIDTEMVRAVPPNVLEKIVAKIPVGRLGQASEIARGVLFLVADVAGFLTGSTLSINGGQHMY